jgi:hypothetical protein
VAADYRPYNQLATANRVTAAKDGTLALSDLALADLKESFYANANGQLQFQATASVNDGCSTTERPQLLDYRCTVQSQPTIQVTGGSVAASPSVARYSYANANFDTLRLTATAQESIYTANIEHTFAVTKGTPPVAQPSAGCAAIKGRFCDFVPRQEGTYSVTLTVKDTCTEKTSTATQFLAQCTDNQKPRFTQADFVIQTESLNGDTAILARGSPLLWDSYKYMPAQNKFIGGFPKLRLSGCHLDAAGNQKSSNTCKSPEGLGIPLWYTFTTRKPSGTTDTQVGDGSRQIENHEIKEKGNHQFRLQILNGENRNKGCSSTVVNQPITAQCLTINPVMRLEKSGSDTATSSVSSSWTGLSFQEVHVYGVAKKTDGSYDGARLYSGGGNAANLDSLQYKWTVLTSPDQSRWVKNTSTTTKDPTTYGDILGRTITEGPVSGNISTITAYRATKKEMTLTKRTTLFNHHHNLPITGFRPDVVGDYTIQLDVNDGCTSVQREVTIQAQCPPSPIFTGSPIAAKAFLQNELHEDSVKCENCNPSARPFGDAGTRSAGGASPTITIAGNSFRRVIADARDILVLGSACSTLTYSWSMYGPKQDDANFDTTQEELTDKKVSGVRYGLTNARGNIVSFVPKRSGAYNITFRACRDTPQHAAESRPMETRPAAALCQFCEEKFIVINVVCDVSDLPKKLPTSTVNNQLNREAIHYIPREGVCKNPTALIPARDRFKDPNPLFGGEHAYFKLEGDPKPVYNASCKVLKRQWILFDRGCAKSFTNQAPPPVDPKKVECKPFECRWRVKTFPCGWDKTAYPANSWVENCNGENCELNPVLKAGNTDRNYTTCIAPFRCRRPGTYTLELIVKDSCSVKTKETVVVCRCHQEIQIQKLVDVDVQKVCQDTSTIRTFQELRLTGDIVPTRSAAPLPGCAKPTPAPAPPAPPAGSCCPAPVPCGTCSPCATCTACPGGAKLPGQVAQSGANPDQHDSPVVPGSILGAMPLRYGDTDVASQPVAPAAGRLAASAVPGALLGMAAVPGAVVPGSSSGVPGISAATRRNGDDFPIVEEILQRNPLVSEDEQEADVSSSMLLGVVIPISLIIVGSLIGNVLMFNKLRRMSKGPKSKSMA